MSELNPENINWEKVNGLIPAIIQDSETKTILMLGYMNPDALGVTLETQLVSFYSRSRKSLWTKGETSGNYLKLVSLKVDCDNDTLLIMATPVGPTCHKGWNTCFNETNSQSYDFLNALSNIIAKRASHSAEKSYTSSLLASGTKRIAQKVGEEGVEVALAATTGDKHEVINESADLLFHLLVLWKDQGVELAEVLSCLKERSSST